MPRRSAFQAVRNFYKSGTFLDTSLAKFPLPKADARLAKEIAFGAVRMKRYLEALASALNKGASVKLKPDEAALLHTALYQAVFLTKIPLYAIIHETVNLAKEAFHESKARFFNAILRKLEQGKPELPIDWDIQYSLPPAFIDMCKKNYKEKAPDIFRALSLPGKTFARDRRLPVSVQSCKEVLVEEVCNSGDYYIQNPTPVSLVEELAKQTTPPRSILDLCASPGGKLFSAHDLYKNAALTANEISKEKLARLKENCSKFHISPKFSTLDGTLFPKDETFDLVIVDVPCSNSGVFSKRPEARWRYTKEQQAALCSLQKQLLRSAYSLTSPQGFVWYMTCSIDPAENTEQTAPYSPLFEMTILPNSQGFEGGYCALIKKQLDF